MYSPPLAEVRGHPLLHPSYCRVCQGRGSRIDEDVRDLTAVAAVCVSVWARRGSGLAWVFTQGQGKRDDWGTEGQRVEGGGGRSKGQRTVCLHLGSLSLLTKSHREQ